MGLSIRSLDYLLYLLTGNRSILFISSEYSGSIRIYEAQQEFINRTFFGIPWASIYLFQFVIPVLTTFIVIKYLSKLNNWAYEQYLTDDQNRRLAKAKSDLNVAIALKVDKQEEFETYASAEELQTQINDLIAQIDALKKSDLENNETAESDKLVISEASENLLRKLANVIYSQEGQIYTHNNGVRVNSEDLALADSYGLISFNASREAISFTDKGKDLYVKINK